MGALFITGATGVVGSALVPPLLETRTERLILLIRAANPEELQRRFDEMLARWRSLPDWQPQHESRLQPVAGDTTRERQGLAPDRRRFLVKAISLLFLVAFAVGVFGSEPKPLRPGSTFTIEFPELGQANHGGTMRSQVFLPDDYTPDRSFPLVVWFGGGAGGHRSSAAVRMVGREGFICAGLPYAKDILWKTPWKTILHMVNGIEQRIPNVDPKRRIAAGFSSGGAMICWLLGNSNGGFQEHFWGIMPGGAGWNMGGLDTLRGRPMMIFMGDQDSRFGGYKSLHQQARNAGVDITFMVFKGHGHGVDRSYYPQMRAWIHEHVLRRDMPETVAAMESALTRRQIPEAISLAREPLSYGNEAEKKRAAQTIEQAERHARDAARRLLDGGASAERLRDFARAMKGLPVAAEVQARAETLAREQLEKMLAGRPTPPMLLRFIEDWAGTEAEQPALAAYEPMAAAQLEKIKAVPNPAMRRDHLGRFVEQWKVGEPVEEAKRIAADMDEQAAGHAFEKIRAVGNENERARQLQRFLARYGKTRAANDAREMYEAMAQEQFAPIRELTNERMRNHRLQGFIRLYTDTAAGREAKTMLKQ